MDSQYKALCALCFLYFHQGIPFGVQIKFLPLYLYSSLGFTIENVTKTGLLMIPWVFVKPFVSPFVTTNTLANKLIHYGIIGTMIINFFLFFIFSLFQQSKSSSSFVLTCLVLAALFLTNVATVIVDICTDRLAITSATSGTDLKFLGMSNSIQVVAYKVGAIFGGISLPLFTQTCHGFILLAVINLVSCISVYHLLPAADKTHQPSDAIPVRFANMYSTFKLISTNHIFYLCGFVMLYKLGENGAVTIYPLLLIDKGVESKTIAMYSSLLSEPLSLLGSIIGGCIWSFFNPKSLHFALYLMIGVVSLLRIIPLGMQTVTLHANGYLVFWPFSNLLLSFAGGMLTTLTFTLMMVNSHSVKDSQKANVYALLSSIEVLGKLVFSSYVGSLMKYVGVFNLYAIFVCLVVLSDIILLWSYKYLIVHSLKIKK